MGCENVNCGTCNDDDEGEELRQLLLASSDDLRNLELKWAEVSVAHSEERARALKMFS